MRFRHALALGLVIPLAVPTVFFSFGVAAAVGGPESAMVKWDVLILSFLGAVLFSVAASSCLMYGISGMTNKDAT